MRYCCLHCLKYDSCQNCFFRGRTTKGHKMNHQMREYCQPSSSWEETKTLLKALKNKLNRNGSKVKTSYLPISSLQPKTTNGESGGSRGGTPSTLRKATNSDYDYPRSPIALSGEHQRELQSIIVRLEDENRHLTKEIDKFHSEGGGGSSGGESRSSGGSSGANNNWDNNPNQQLMARQELLEDHTHQMELQIKRLKHLLQYISRGDSVPQYPRPPNLPLPPTPEDNNMSQSLAERGGYFESTPLEGVNVRRHAPPQQWSPFVKLQTELDNLERLTTGLQENSRNGGNPFGPNRTRRSCRGVSFTDRLEHFGGGDGTPRCLSSPLQRQGSVRPKMGGCMSTSSSYNKNTPCSYSPCNNNNSEVDSCLSIYDNCSPRNSNGGRAHFLPDSGVSLVPNRSCLLDQTAEQATLPPLPPPTRKTASRLDAELQTIIEQLERVLPNTWASSPSFLPGEKAKMLLAMTEVEEAMSKMITSEQPNGHIASSSPQEK